MTPGFSGTLAKLERSGIMPKTAPNLERMQEGLRALGFTPEKILEVMKGDLQKVILIAGTNGKGSVGATLEALLAHTGARTGFYSSPHLESYCERFRINGHPISEEIFVAAYDRVIAKCAHLSLSHFETLTLMAAEIFFGTQITSPVDWAIFEVGLGGRWDATNAIAHGTAIFTTIDYDHTEILGPHLRDIAKNKFAIIPFRSNELPQGALVVSPRYHEEIHFLLADFVNSRQVKEWVTTESAQWTAQTEGEPLTYQLNSPWGTARLALLGDRAAHNTLLALTAYARLGFDPAIALSALEKVKWPGRMELIEYKNRQIYLSGDHNPSGVQSLLQILKALKYRHLHLIVGIGLKKDFQNMLELLSSLDNLSFYLTESPFEGRPLKDYGEWLNRAQGTDASPDTLLERVLARSDPRDLIVVTGSLYLVGFIRSKIHSNQK